jgi:hypothetical protein
MPERVNAAQRALMKSSGTGAFPLTASQARTAIVVVFHKGRLRSRRPLPRISMLASEQEHAI